MAEEEFRCRAINDYFASVTDELDLKEGHEYTIMQTSPSGWWYAVNDDGEDGWVPSNYLERIDGGGGSGGSGGSNDNKPQQVKESIDNGQQDNNDVQQEEPELQPESDHENEIVEEQPKVWQATQTKQDKQSNAQPKQSNAQPKQSNAQPKQESQINIQPVQYNNISDEAPDKPITEWNVEETLSYLKHASSLKQRNDFKVTQACRYLTQLATDNNQCQEVLASEGLDIVFEIMRTTAGDVAIQMSCCAAVVVICANPASKQYPAKINGIYYISQGIKDNINYAPFVILAFNAVCNFCHDHNIHRAMALETDIVDTIIQGMAHHVDKNDGNRVHCAGCLALRNIAAEAKGQAAIGPNGVTTITEGLSKYRQNKDVVEGSMGVLCNLCALPANGEAFVMGNGIQLLDSLFDDADAGINVRLAAASVLHNLAANPDTALLLSSDDGIDLLIKIIKKADIESPLFLNMLKVLAALLFKLPEDKKPAGNKKPEVMQRVVSKGLLATLNEAVKYDSKELREMSATLLVVIAQTSPQLAQAIADADCPSQLITPCEEDPTTQTLHCSIAIWFHVSDAFQNQQRLIENGVLRMLSSKWYKQPQTKDDTVRIACGVFIKLCSNVRNAAAFNKIKESINEFISWCKQNKPQLSDLCNAIENALKNMDPMATSDMHIQQSYQSVPSKQNQNQNQNQSNKQVKKDEKKEEPKEESKDVKNIAKQAKVSNADSVRPSVTAAPVEPTTKTHADSESSSGNFDTGGKFYSYEDLKSGKAKVDKNNKEAYLSDQEFVKVLGMNREQFYQEKPWKQKNIKKSKGLF